MPSIIHNLIQTISLSFVFFSHLLKFYSGGAVDLWSTQLALAQRSSAVKFELDSDLLLLEKLKILFLSPKQTLADQFGTCLADLGFGQKSSAVKFEFDSDLLFLEMLRILQCSKVMVSGL